MSIANNTINLPNSNFPTNTRFKTIQITSPQEIFVIPASEFNAEQNIAALVVEGGVYAGRGIRLGNSLTRTPGTIYYDEMTNAFYAVDGIGQTIELGGGIIVENTPSISLEYNGRVLTANLQPTISGNYHFLDNVTINNLSVNSITFDTLTVLEDLTVGTTLKTLNAVVTNLSVLSTGIVLGYGASSLGLTIPGVAIGYNAGNSSLQNSIAIGNYARNINTNVSLGSVAIGNSAGQINMSNFSVAIGQSAGQNEMSDQSVAIGFNAGNINMASNSVAIGQSAGYSSMLSNSIAIGNSAGYIGMGLNSIAIGNIAGQGYLGASSITIGTAAGYIGMSTKSIAIGNSAGQNNMGSSSIVIGEQAGFNNMGSNSVAIGRNASYNNPGFNSYIVINGTGNVLNPNGNNRCFVSPIRAAVGTNYLLYDPTTREITTSASIPSDQRLKTNIIDIDAALSLEKVCQLRPVNFNFVPSYFSSDLQTGFIAQEVEQIFPEYVIKSAPSNEIEREIVGENGEVYSLPMDNKFLVVHLVNAMKGLQYKNETLDIEKQELKNRMLLCEEKNRLLEEKINEICSRLNM
jgi:hypothetical protein